MLLGAGNHNYFFFLGRRGTEKFIAQYLRQRAKRNALVKEVLRIRPVVSGVGRVVHGEEPYELDGHLIPPGTEINPGVMDTSEYNMTVTLG